jgi:formylglycine-generating enzyme required for sulfatase activity
MVAVAGRVCVDRYETVLIDGVTEAAWSPFYPPDRERARSIFSEYESAHRAAPRTPLDAALEVPRPPLAPIAPQALNKVGVLPQGYLSADEAEGACHAAGKRLCTETEWVTACRGESNQDFPYGDHYIRGACNVDRESHPSVLLHDNAARYHDDPRNNLVTVDGKPLLQTTGSSSRCASRWGDDAIYDMVGNLDEWVSDARGVFVGGFYSRGTQSGCASRVSNHPRAYSDYSTGARCCADPGVEVADGQRR